MKIGGRLGSRTVLAVSDPSHVLSNYTGIRRQRRSQVSDPYDTNNNGTTPEDIKWTHDLYEGVTDAGSIAFVRNLPTSVTKQQLSKLFNEVGEVVSIKIDPGPLTTARIGFVKKASAAEAAVRFHGYKMQQRLIKVSEFNSLDEKDKQRRIGRDSDEEIDDDANMESLVFQRPFKRTSNHSMRRSILISDAPQRSVFDRMA